MSGQDEGTLEAPRRFTADNYAYAAAPRLGVRGWLRWSWRQVTSMRLALVLLLLLALAAIPGSLLPQRPQDPGRAQRFLDANGAWGSVADALGLLDVFGSAWFTAIYVLLFASLVGCIVPRAIAHAKAAREAVAPAPRSLARYSPSEPASSLLTVDDAVTALVAWGRRRGLARVAGYRTRVDERTGSRGTRVVAVSLEQGSVREWGNLAFHLGLVAVLASLAYGAAFTYRGQAVVVEGQTFTNAVVAYDSFSAGRLFDEADLSPFTMTLDRFEPVWDATGRATDFTAFVSISDEGAASDETIKVNSPLTVEGGKIYLQGNGYAPSLTVTDADGNVAFSGPVPFLPQDSVYTSTGVVKVPDVTSGPQMGLRATLYPTAAEGQDGTVVSLNPEAINPVILLTAYSGDLGLDTGVPQNVYRLDESGLTQLTGDDGEPLVVALRPGETITLPNGLGTVTWDALPRFVALDLRADPSLPWMLASSLAMIAGVAVSLFSPRRRLWFHVEAGHSPDAPTLVTAACLAPAHDDAAGRALARALAVSTGAPADSPAAREASLKEEW